jgi:hypothetical protein
LTPPRGLRTSWGGLARRWRVAFTPTIVFFREEAPQRMGREVEVARMHGLMPKPDFLALFVQVAERGHADGTPSRPGGRGASRAEAALIRSGRDRASGRG